VAGQRAGLDGARSGLWFEFQRILSELRPRWALIENVPGLLSSNQGRDFATILDGLGECGFGGIAWAVLDSQHFGVAQRRRRVFIVCGPTRRSAEQVLSLCEGCGGHSQTGRAAGEDVAAPLGASSTSFGGQRFDLDNETYVPELSFALAARNAKGVSLLDSQDTFVVRTAQTSANGHGVSELAHALDGANGQAVVGTLKGGRGEARDSSAEAADRLILAPPIAQTLNPGHEAKHTYPGDGGEMNLIAHTLRADGFDASEDGTGRGTPLVDVAQVQWASGGGQVENPTAQALRAGAEHSYQFARLGASVRRLTPTECLRLQAFPDDWLDLDPPLSDGAKYRMCGNAVTVSTIEYIGRRIMALREPQADQEAQQ
jgi:DNA (cytosine-5)-methyltransferase 1